MRHRTAAIAIALVAQCAIAVVAALLPIGNAPFTATVRADRSGGDSAFRRVDRRRVGRCDSLALRRGDVEIAAGARALPVELVFEVIAKPPPGSLVALRMRGCGKLVFGDHSIEDVKLEPGAVFRDAGTISSKTSCRAPTR